MPADWSTMPMRWRIAFVALGGVEAEHRDLAGGPLAVPLEDLDGRGLAGAVRPEEREDLAVLDRQVDALDGLELAVRLAQPFDDDRGHVPERTGVCCNQ